MLRVVCKSKIHNLHVTSTALHYQGSISVDKKILDAANILPFERVQILNINNGARLETYVMEAEAGSGTVCLNGAAARMGQVADELIIISYALMDESELKAHRPIIVFVDEENRVKERKG
jgi:aspartate 1-decarboxylase